MHQDPTRTSGVSFAIATVVACEISREISDKIKIMIRFVPLLRRPVGQTSGNVSLADVSPLTQDTVKAQIGIGICNICNVTNICNDTKACRGLSRSEEPTSLPLEVSLVQENIKELDDKCASANLHH